MKRKILSIIMGAILTLGSNIVLAQVVRTPPPDLRYEVTPEPRNGYVWSPGYWRWQNHRYVWQHGRWLREQRGKLWIPESWEEDEEGRFHFIPGHWERTEDEDYPADDRDSDEDSDYRHERRRWQDDDLYEYEDRRYREFRHDDYPERLLEDRR